MSAYWTDHGVDFGATHRSCNELRVRAASEDRAHRGLHGPELKPWTLEYAKRGGYASYRRLASDFFGIVSMGFVGLLLSFVFAVISLYLAYRNWVCAKVIARLNTSRLDSVTRGFVKLQGRAKAYKDNVKQVPGTETACVWYDYVVVEAERHGEGSRERIIKLESSSNPIILRDSTGVCTLRTIGADIIPRHRKRWQEGALTYTFEWISPGDRLYVLGWLETLNLKAPIVKQKAKFPERKNRSSSDSIKALEAALDRVEQETTEKIVKKPKTGGLPYIISVGPESRAIARYRNRALLWLSLFVVASVVAGTILVMA